MAGCDPILCLSHCDLSQTVLCLSVPSVCPVCSQSMSGMKIPPFRLPSPLSSSLPFSVVIRPTQGSFLESYHKDSDLHVGVCDSRGVVYDFDEKGIHRSLQGWPQCVVVQVIGSKESAARSLWDIKLMEIVGGEEWRAEHYDELNWNCYDFVVGFLKELGMEDLGDKERFCIEKVLPETKKAAKYLALYRRICQQGYVVQGARLEAEEMTTL